MNRPEVECKLKEILFDIIRETDGCQVRSAEAIDAMSDFSTLDVTSVDLMEFVLLVEQVCDVSVLENLLPENLPTTLNGWTNLTLAQLATS